MGVDFDLIDLWSQFGFLLRTDRKRGEIVILEKIIFFPFSF